MLNKATSKLFFAIVGLIVIILSFSSSVGAEAEPGPYSWTATPPYTFSSTLVTGISPSFCAVPHTMIEVDGEVGQKRACVIHKGNISFGMYYNAWWRFVTVIGFEHSNKMYRLDATCDGYESCIYVPKFDMLITKQNKVNGLARSLIIYRNFSSRIKPVVNGVSRAYEFDYANPDYTLQSTDGRPWAVNGTGVSADGNWLAVEIMQRGIGMLDLRTMEMKRISQIKLSYSQGSNSQPEIAVSGDGTHVALMGLNTPLTIYEISPDCGEMATDEIIRSDAPSSNNCKQATVNFGGFINHFWAGIYPRFDTDGGELNFYAYAYNGETRAVTLRASGYNGQRIDYLALGDSFSSGEGEIQDDYYLDGTNEPFEKCHVSSRSYPFLVASMQNIDHAFVRSVACSGAATEDVIGDSSKYFGQWSRLDTGGLNLSVSEKSLAQSLAKENFVPGRIYQEKFVEKYKPAVITLGIGGNDINLIGKLVSCAGIGTCDLAKDLKLKEQTAVEIAGLFPKLVNTYTKLHVDSSNSKIYVVGYPQSVDPTGKCDAVISRILDETERIYLNESIKYLNQVIQAAAKSAGVGYIDVEDSLGNQVLCGDTEPIAMNGVRTGDDLNYGWVLNLGNESFHPNPTGHSLIAGKINETISNLRSSEYCEDKTTFCPDGSVSIPEPSNYWIPYGYHDYNKLTAKLFLSDSKDGSSRKNISVGNYSFAPNSQVDVEITSEPRFLGSFNAGSSGDLNASIELPSDLDYGYHIVHLYGLSYVDEPIEIYQIIEYRRQPEPEMVLSAGLNEPQPVTKTNTWLNKTIVNPLVASEPLVVRGSQTTDYIHDGDEEIAKSLGNPAVEGATTTRIIPAPATINLSKPAQEKPNYDWLFALSIAPMLIIAGFVCRKTIKSRANQTSRRA